MFTQEETNLLFTKFILAFLDSIPFNIERIGSKEFAMFLFPVLMMVMEDPIIQKTLEHRFSDELLEIPIVRDHIVNMLDDHIKKTERNLKNTRRWRNLIEHRIRGSS